MKKEQKKWHAKCDWLSQEYQTHAKKKNYEKKYIHDKFKPFLKEKMR